MAEVDDRGQLLLVTGILLAVVFVALALLVNTAIYTDNVATRGGDSAGEALEYQAGVTDSVGGLIDAENAAADDGDSFEAINESVADGVSGIDATIERNHLRRAAATETHLSGTTEGRLIRGANTTGFESWRVNASSARGFTIDLDTENMTDGSPFRIDLNGTELEVNRTGGEIVVEGVTENIECSVPAAETVRFDVTGERIGGQPCRFGWPELDADSQIALGDAEHGAGEYALTIRSDEDLASLPSNTTRAVYSADVELRLDAPDLHYRTTVRVAPGEPDV